jgi:hypothetical protein
MSSIALLAMIVLPAVSEPLRIDAAAVTAQPSYEAELLSDAASRTLMLGDEQSPNGYINGKFTLGDGGPNKLIVGGFMQNRYMGNFRDRPDATHDSYTGGFQVARARLKFAGTVWDKNFSYFFLTELSNRSGNTTILDAEMKYTFDNKVYVRAGQYKPLYMREELVIDPLQLTVDRSLTNGAFTLTRSQGAGVGWTGSSVRMGADITDGGSNLNTEFDSRKEADFAVTGRAEWLWAGTDFKRFDDFTSYRGQTYTGMIGAAIDWETFGQSGPGTIGGAPDQRIFGATADVSAEGDGWNAYGAFMYRNRAPAGAEDRKNYGLVVQGGVFVTEQTEAFARYDVIFPDDADGPDSFNTITAGASYYLSPKSSVAKLTGDVVYYADPTNSTAIISTPNTTVNLLPDTKGNQVALRLQLQVIF